MSTGYLTFGRYALYTLEGRVTKWHKISCLKKQHDTMGAAGLESPTNDW